MKCEYSPKKEEVNMITMPKMKWKTIHGKMYGMAIGVWTPAGNAMIVAESHAALRAAFEAMFSGMKVKKEGICDVEVGPDSRKAFLPPPLPVAKRQRTGKVKTVTK